MSQNHHMRRSSVSGGLFLVALGLLLLADRFGLPVPSPLAASIGLVVTWIGISALLEPSRSGTRGMGAFVLLTVGCLLVLNGIGITRVALGTVWSYAWPLLLVALGFAVLITRDNQIAFGPGHHQFKVIGDYRLDASQLTELTQRSLWSVVGDIRLDLTGAQLREGVTHIAVYSVVGDTHVFVPADLAVEVRSSSLVGDSNLFGQRYDGVGTSAMQQTTGYAGATRKLRIKIDSVVGDIVVRRVS